MPAPRVQRLLDAAGFRVNVVEWGEPGHPPVLLLHGGMAHARWWDLTAARLADRFRLVALDMPGHGDSPWRAPDEYRTEAQIAIVSELLMRLAAEPWTLCGHSHGALVATLVAASSQAPLRRLVLVEMPLRPGSARLMRAGERFRRIRQPQFTTLEEGLAAFRLFPDDGDAPREVVRYVAEHSLRAHPEGGYTTKFDWRFFGERPPATANPFAEFPRVLDGLRCPTLVVRGERSTIVPAADHEEMIRRLPRGAGAVIATASHNPHLENPAATAAAIATFALEPGLVAG